MFENTVKFIENQKVKDKIIAALNCVCSINPHHSGIAVLLKIYESKSQDTAGITQSGKLLINPEFLEKLSLRDLAFVLDHEIMHLVLKTHDRQGDFPDSKLVNIAHDFIINGELKTAFEMNEVPANALNWDEWQYRIQGWKPIEKYSLEKLVVSLKNYCHCNSNQGGGGTGGSLGDLLAKAGITGSKTDSDSSKTLGDIIYNRSDVIIDKTERKLFPDEKPENIAAQQQAIRVAAVRAYTEAVLQKKLDNYSQIKESVEHGTEPGNGYGMFELLRGSYTTPWEAALQRWFDSVAPGDRSFSRASRRGAWRTDVVLPGRKREGWTIHIVLDTSGSMTSSLRYALGAIDQFCQNNNVETVHILQCDTGVTADEWLEIGNLENFQAKGFGGSDMSPGMLALAEDPDVAAVIVITDGYIDYPSQQPPYDVLWCIVDNGRTNFNYGTAIRIDAK